MNNSGTKEAIFDISRLKINKVTLGIETKELNTKYALRGAKDPILGQALWVEITPEVKQINIYYETTEKSEALDWLDSALTSSKSKPFLYTQLNSFEHSKKMALDWFSLFGGNYHAVSSNSIAAALEVGK